MYIIVAGNRSFNNYGIFKEALDKYISSFEFIEKEEITIVTSIAEGVDAMADVYAYENGYALLRLPIHWHIFGDEAWKQTNKDMARIGNVLLAFWDGVSSGTGHMIEVAKEQRLAVTIFDWTKQ